MFEVKETNDLSARGNQMGTGVPGKGVRVEPRVVLKIKTGFQVRGRGELRRLHVASPCTGTQKAFKAWEYHFGGRTFGREWRD